MTQQDFIKEFINYPPQQKEDVMKELLRIYENDKNGKSSKPEKFVIEAFSLELKKEFDFDNIGKLISEIEGDFHK